MRLNAYDSAFATTGPVATACLDVSRDGESGARELELRWQALRDDLSQSGAADDVLTRLDEAVLAPTGLAGGWGRVVAATADRVLVDRVVPGRPRAHAWWDRLPHLMPLLEAESAAVTYLLAQVDRTGADITVSARGEPVISATESVEGEEHHVRKVHAGGWSDLRYQHTVENVWESNAGDVAARIDRLATEAAVDLVVVAGDVRATQLLRESVSERTRERLHVLDSGARNAGAADEPVTEQLTALREHTAAQRARGHVDTYLEQKGRGERAASGLAATVEALRRGQVEVLLVPQGWDDHEPAYLGDDPTLLGLKSDELVSLGVAEPVQAPVSDAVVRAAVGTDAQLVVVPEALLGMGGEPAAVLRFTDESTVHTSENG
jgi:hypothetical protein